MSDTPQHDGRPGHGRPGHGRPGDDRSGDDRSGDDRSGHGRSNPDDRPSRGGRVGGGAGARAAFVPVGRHKSFAAFREHLRGVAPDLDASAEPRGADGPLGRPLEVAGRTLTNRFAIHPMEGWDGARDGTPSPDTLRRWRRFGESGADLIWGGEAFAVTPDGKANPNQLAAHPGVDTRAGLARLLAALHEGRASIESAAGGSGGSKTGGPPRSAGRPDGLLVGLQLTHSGRFAVPEPGRRAPRIAYHHPVLDARFGIAPDHAPLTDGELEEIGEAYVRAAVLAAEVGFDFVDLKACHGYLVHELLGARARPGRFGGSFENRTRWFRDVAGAIRVSAPDLSIGVRVSLADVFPFAKDPESGLGAPLGWDRELPWPHGFGLDPADPRSFDLTEPFRFLSLLQELGIRLVNITLGSPYYCPHLQRPAAYPPSDGYGPPEDPLLGVAAHLRVVRAVKARFPELVVVGTGYSYLQQFLPHVAEHEVEAGHVDLVGLGRMVLSYPELPRDVLAGRELDRKKICRTFSDCTTAPRNGLKSGCYPLDPHYRTSPEFARLAAIKDELRRRSR